MRSDNDHYRSVFSFPGLCRNTHLCFCAATAFFGASLPSLLGLRWLVVEFASVVQRLGIRVLVVDAVAVAVVGGGHSLPRSRVAAGEADSRLAEEPELNQGADRLALPGSMLHSEHTSAAVGGGGPLRLAAVALGRTALLSRDPEKRFADTM